MILGCSSDSKVSEKDLNLMRSGFSSAKILKAEEVLCNGQLSDISSPTFSKKFVPFSLKFSAARTPSNCTVSFDEAKIKNSGNIDDAILYKYMQSFVGFCEIYKVFYFDDPAYLALDTPLKKDRDTIKADLVTFDRNFKFINLTYPDLKINVEYDAFEKYNLPVRFSFSGTENHLMTVSYKLTDQTPVPKNFQMANKEMQKVFEAQISNCIIQKK